MKWTEKFLTLPILLPLSFALLLPVHAKPSSQFKELRILEYNVNGLLEQPDIDKTTGEFTYKAIDPVLIQLKADAILKEDPDIAVLIETEGLEQTRNFARLYLRDKYVVFRAPGNSVRKMEIAMLVRRGRFEQARYRSHRNFTFRDPVDGEIKPIWSRDLPLLFLFSKKDAAEPEIVIGGVHLKSMRPDPSRGADAKGTILSKQQELHLIGVYEDLVQEIGPNVPVVFAGDYNRQIENPETFVDLKKVLKEAFVSAPFKASPAHRKTQMFFSSDERLKTSQFDTFFLSDSAATKIIDVKAVHQPDCDGALVRPTNFKERNTRFGSDHIPVVLDLYMPQMAQAAIAP